MPGQSTAHLARFLFLGPFRGSAAVGLDGSSILGFWPLHLSSGAAIILWSCSNKNKNKSNHALERPVCGPAKSKSNNTAKLLGYKTSYKSQIIQ
jgi:hypothetical protein